MVRRQYLEICFLMLGVLFQPNLKSKCGMGAWFLNRANVINSLFLLFNFPFYQILQHAGDIQNMKLIDP